MQKWPKKCFIYKFRGKCVRYWPKNPLKNPFSPQLLLFGQTKQVKKKIHYGVIAMAVKIVGSLF